jgi:hypothetical protein
MANMKAVKYERIIVAAKIIENNGVSK